MFFWDTPLEGWGSRAAIFGSAVLLCNVARCLAYIRSYRSMFAWRSNSKQLALPGRLILGAWMLVSGANHFFFSLWPMPTGTNHPPFS